jgi:hypothetical protein
MEALAARWASRAAMIGWGLGFLLLFVGSLVAIILTNPGSCIGNTSAPPCSASDFAGFYNGLFIGKLLFAIGLLLIGGASGLKLHYGSPKPSSGSSDDLRWVMHERWASLIVIVVTVVLLFIVLIPLGVTVP